MEETGAETDELDEAQRALLEQAAADRDRDLDLDALEREILPETTRSDPEKRTLPLHRDPSATTADGETILEVTCPPCGERVIVLRPETGARRHRCPCDAVIQVE